MPKNIFEYSNSILKKTSIVESPEEFEKFYSPFIMNRLFSCDMQTILLANEMNMNYGYTKKMHFDFMMTTVRKTNKFIKYEAKKEKKDKELQYIMEFYGCNSEVAKQYHGLISEADLDKIVEYYENRGVKK